MPTPSRCWRAWPSTTASTSTRPSRSCRRSAQQVLLHGSGEREHRVRLRGRGRQAAQARSVKRSHPFEGIMPNLERRFRETDSAAVREDLARYQAAKPCPDCGGTRLRREARHVFLQPTADAGTGEPIYEVEHATLAECLALLRGPAAAGRQGRDRRQGGARDPLAAEVPQRRGPELPEPGPQRRHAVRRRGAAHPPGQPDRHRA